METAQRLEVLCDKVPAQQHVVPAVVAAIGDRLGTWRIVVHERHRGNCWDVHIDSSAGVERHFVFIGDSRSPEHVRETIAREFAEHGLELAKPARGADGGRRPR